jgi:endonuclease YncB( thermonuclease family)
VQTASQEVFSGKVVGVSDGDTLQVMHAGQAVKVRLHGIDCPEKAQAYGQRARQFTSEHVFGKPVKVVVRDRDRYGRLVGDVYLQSGWHLNHELLDAGLAWWYEQYAPKDTQLASLQHTAQRAKRGLWSDPQAIPPWTFRKQPRSQAR